jgi:hypothetical protein
MRSGLTTDLRVRDTEREKVEHAKTAILQKGRDNTRIPMPVTLLTMRVRKTFVTDTFS